MKAFAICLLAGGMIAGSPLRAQTEQAPAREKPAREKPASETNAPPEKDLSGWLLANFLLLVAGLGYLGVKYGKPYFQGQTDTIGRALTEARLRKTDAEVRAAEVDRKLANLDTDIDRLRRSILEERDAQVERMRKQADVEADRVRINAAQQIDSAGKHARLELQRFASQLAIELAEQRARARMTPSVHQALTKQFVESLRA